MSAALLPVAPSDDESPAQALLPLKTTTPPPRSEALLRPDLQALLSEVRLIPLTVVTAPAGYGKTTLLSQWVQELKRTGAPVAWLTLDTGDRQPALFLAYLIRAFQATFPAVGHDAWRALHSAANLERDWPLVAGALCGELQRKVVTAAFLFLDDLHYVSDSAVIGQILGYLLRAAPPALHVVMASRRALTFAPLSRLRAEGQLLDVSQSDLHMSASEVRQILVARGVELSDSEVRLLIERTAGWALSVQLAARALANQPPHQRSTFVRSLGGSQEQLLDYLANEVLADLPEEMVEFLRLAALPATFDAALLREALLWDHVDYLLQRSQMLGLPIEQYGAQLRFHPLWREMLLRDLPQKLDGETLRAIHLRFGRSLEARGDLEAALDHYASAGASEDLARALRERALPLLRSPQRDTVRRWLEQLPPGMIRGDVDLLYMWGISQSPIAPEAAIPAIWRASDMYIEAARFEDALQALADLAALMFWQVHPEEFDRVCRRAIEVANRVRTPRARGAARVCAVALLFGRGREEPALRVARQANSYPLTTIWRWLLAHIVATLCAQIGRPAEAIAAVDSVLQLPQVDLDDRLRQNLLRQRAVALYAQGHTSEAIRVALDAHRYLSDYYHGNVSAFGALDLALLLALEQRVDEAETYIGQARAVFQEIGALEPLANLQAIEVYCMMVRGKTIDACTAVSSALHHMREARRPPPDLRLWLMLSLVLGRCGDHQRALALIDETIAGMEEHGYRLYLAAAQLYRAHLAGLTGEARARREALQAGWELLAADDQQHVPMLPQAVLRDVAEAALQANIEPVMVGRVLRQQLAEESAELLLSLLNNRQPAVRATAARLLGESGAPVAFNALRAMQRDRHSDVRRAVEETLARLSHRPPYRLRIRTLGAFGLWRGEQEVRDRDWRSGKARQLFQYLLTERGRTLTRDQILEVLWPEMEPDAAANNLRVTISRLSRAIEPDRPDGAPSSYVLQQGDTFSFNTQSDYQLDAEEFVSAVEEGQRAEQQGQRQAAIAAYRRATTLYGGPFLPDNLYEDWTVVERERLVILFNNAALRLGMMVLDEGLAHEAIGLGWRVLEHDLAHEEAYRLLIRAHAYLGERSTAMRLYERCVRMLRQELGVDPMPATVALYTAMRQMQ